MAAKANESSRENGVSGAAISPLEPIQGTPGEEHHQWAGKCWRRVASARHELEAAERELLTEHATHTRARTRVRVKMIEDLSFHQI